MKTSDSSRVEAFNATLPSISPKKYRRTKIKETAEDTGRYLRDSTISAPSTISARRPQTLRPPLARLLPPPRRQSRCRTHHRGQRRRRRQRDLYLRTATISACKPRSPRAHRRQSGTGPRATTSPLLRPASCRASCRIWETKTERREGHPAVLRTEGEGRDANVVEDSPVENCRANPAAVATNAFQTSPTNLLPVATPRSSATRRCAKRNSHHQRATPALTSFLSGGRGRFVQQRDRSPRTLEHELLLAGRSQPRGQHRRLSVALSRTTLQRSP